MYNWNISFILISVILVNCAKCKQTYLDEICGHINGQRVYLEHGEVGTLEAQYENNIIEGFNRKMNKSNDGRVGSSQKGCTIEFVTCPFCVIGINFRFLNISRNCRKSVVFDKCGCDYLWAYEPSYEEVSGEQFCGFFVKNNISNLEYVSQTRKVAVTFFYNSRPYGLAFSLDYYSKRNRIFITGTPTRANINNGSQLVTSPFFPNFYPKDLSIEHVISCNSAIICRISWIFIDFQVADSSIIEFFDWNGQRLYVTTGNAFRPPVITSSGPSLVVRFHANGVSYTGYKAMYSFVLGDLNETQFKPNIDCGGHVNNLGGGITMINMVQEGTKFFDCVWIIKPPESYLHLKTHLYVKLITFSNLVGNSEISIHQGQTSTGPLVEHLRLPLANFYHFKQKEHVVPISQGFYISLRGLFRPESSLTIVYAAFNYKDCYAGSDFLCHNFRCISILLNCDGFDHCGDNSDESSIKCSRDPRDRRQWSQTPNFLFPKVEGYSDLTAATIIYLLCSIGIGLIFFMVVLLYRINMKARHQRQIRNHIETIHAILDGGGSEIEEEIIISDDPPEYEHPPEYGDVVKLTNETEKLDRSSMVYGRGRAGRSSRCKPLKPLMSKCRSQLEAVGSEESKPKDNFGVRLDVRQHVPQQGTSRDFLQIPASQIPDSPPPVYVSHENVSSMEQDRISEDSSMSSDAPGPSGLAGDGAQEDQSPPSDSGSNFSRFSALQLNKTKSETRIFNAKKIDNFRSNRFIKRIRHLLDKEADQEDFKYFSESELDSLMQYYYNGRGPNENLARSLSTDNVSAWTM